MSFLDVGVRETLASSQARANGDAGETDSTTYVDERSRTRFTPASTPAAVRESYQFHCANHGEIASSVSHIRAAGVLQTVMKLPQGMIRATTHLCHNGVWDDPFLRTEMCSLPVFSSCRQHVGDADGESVQQPGGRDLTGMELAQQSVVIAFKHEN
jgi:hypothetical protein